MRQLFSVENYVVGWELTVDVDRSRLSKVYSVLLGCRSLSSITIECRKSVWSLIADSITVDDLRRLLSFAINFHRSLSILMRLKPSNDNHQSISLYRDVLENSQNNAAANERSKLSTRVTRWMSTHKKPSSLIFDFAESSHIKTRVLIVTQHVAAWSRNRFNHFPFSSSSSLFQTIDDGAGTKRR